jgi:predicted DNA-binding protein (MmcQ/YjbR family)
VGVKKQNPEVERVRRLALTYPETYEESPWGERVVKVRRKVFVFVGSHDTKLSVSLKLPDTGGMALALPFATPTGYGLGKSGWVTARFAHDDDVPHDLLEEWVDESYRAVAPKKLVRQLDEAGGPTPAKPAKPAKPASKAKAPSNKAKAKRGRGPALLLIGEDPLRLARAVAALAALGLTNVATSDHESAPRRVWRRKALVVFDLGRRAVAGLDLSGELLEGRTKADAPRVAFTGIRDARFERRVQGEVPRGTPCHRQAPGDPAVAAALAKLVGVKA